MGTKLQYVISPLGGTSKKDTFAVNQLVVWEYFRSIGPKEQFQKRGLDEFQWSMDRMLEPHNIASIKKTMLMHENIFQQQVRELHRLYSVQRMLMNELTKELEQNKNKASIAGTSSISHYYSYISNQHQPISSSHDEARNGPNSRERSGSSSGENLRRIPMGFDFDLERPAEEDNILNPVVEADQAGPSAHIPLRNTNSSTHSMDEDCDLELTLSIGCSTSKERKESHQFGGSSDSIHHTEFKENGVKSDGGEECSEPNNAVSSSSMAFNQESNRPGCLFHGRSLNRA